MPLFGLLVMAAFAVVLGAGKASNWTTQAEAAEQRKRDLARPPLFQGQIFGGAAKRWYFWYVLDSYGRVRWVGPLAYTNAQVFELETGVERNELGTTMYRFVYSPTTRTWVHDTRSKTVMIGGAWGLGPGARSGSSLEPQASSPLFGAYPPPQVFRGKWTLGKLPAKIRLHGVWFEKTKWFWPKENVVAEYREMKARNSMHLFVVFRGAGMPLEYVVPHIDEANPDQGLELEHLIKDVLGTEIRLQASGRRLLRAPSPKPRALLS